MRFVPFVLALLVLGCSGCPTPVPPAPPPPPAPGEATCGDVCAQGRELVCPWAAPTPEGASCEAVCSNIQDSGIVAWNLDCRARARSCRDAEACETP